MLSGVVALQKEHTPIASTNKMSPPFIGRGPSNGELVSLAGRQVLHVAFEILVESGLCIHTKHTPIKAEKQMSRRTVQRTRSLRTIAAPLIAIALVLTACGSDGPAEDPSIPNTFRGKGGSHDN